MLSEAKVVKLAGGEVGGGALGDLKLLRLTNSLVSDCGLTGITGRVTVVWIGSSIAWPEQPVSASLPVSLTGSMRNTLPGAQVQDRAGPLLDESAPVERGRSGIGLEQHFDDDIVASVRERVGDRRKRQHGVRPP